MCVYVCVCVCLLPFLHICLSHLRASGGDCCSSAATTSTVLVFSCTFYAFGFLLTSLYTSVLCVLCLCVHLLRKRILRLHMICTVNSAADSFIHFLLVEVCLCVCSLKVLLVCFTTHTHLYLYMYTISYCFHTFISSCELLLPVSFPPANVHTTCCYSIWCCLHIVIVFLIACLHLVVKNEVFAIIEGTKAPCSIQYFI